VNFLSRDQVIGGAILAVCIIVIIGYLILVVDPALFNLNSDTARLDAVLILVSAAFIAILAIGAWIGWTMATTPPPKPIEEITTEIEEKKVEEKNEEAKPNETTAQASVIPSNNAEPPKPEPSRVEEEVKMESTQPEPTHATEEVKTEPANVVAEALTEPSLAGEETKSELKLPPVRETRDRGSKIIDIEGIGAVYAQKLNEINIYTTTDLLEAGATPAKRRDLAEKTGISDRLLLRWINMADLFRIKGVGEEYSDLLEAAGVDTVVELAKRVPENLRTKMLEVNAEKNLVRRPPTLNEVKLWIQEAKTLQRKIEY
jgi:predicted flap endonuclease-1-like 5' DNA nuclease/predicted DNA-binding transcriptional regulator